ncbi:hypothetical protein KAI46_12785 [bacterium]|nr:hypothetical protein [bacterium]
MTEPVTKILVGLYCPPMAAQGQGFQSRYTYSQCGLYNNFIKTRSQYEEHAGIYRTGQITGTIKISTIPGSRRVTLFDHRTMRLEAITWADPETGAYTFTGLSTEPGRRYLVVCDDYTQTYNAAIADWVMAEATPV